LPDDTVENLGNITTVRFINPSGLKSIGSNLFLQSASSGAPIEGIPNQDGFGALQQSSIEKSNVDVVKEMVNMIVAQRSYDINSKTINSADEMLRTVAGLKR
nr:flagellar hook-basal body complex protein [Petrotogaceae bacterium]